MNRLASNGETTPPTQWATPASCTCLLEADLDAPRAVGQGELTGHGQSHRPRARAEQPKTVGSVGDDVDVGVRPQSPRASNGGLQHRDVAEIEQVVAAVVK